MHDEIRWIFLADAGRPIKRRPWKSNVLPTATSLPIFRRPHWVISLKPVTRRSKGAVFEKEVC
ncbi:hypothetical protein [Acidocella sp.]|jgi:hypothetical protein|uniref:hypothetical protein n=1 Tax=Acidocella sp. TaxID=50710 RepID=UPI002F41EA6D